MMATQPIPQSGWQKFVGFLSGKKTFFLAMFALGYIATADWLTGEAPKQEVVDGLLAGMAWTIRLGISKAGG